MLQRYSARPRGRRAAPQHRAAEGVGRGAVSRFRGVMTTTVWRRFPRASHEVAPQSLKTVAPALAGLFERNSSAFHGVSAASTHFGTAQTMSEEDSFNPAHEQEQELLAFSSILMEEFEELAPAKTADGAAGA